MAKKLFKLSNTEEALLDKVNDGTFDAEIGFIRESGNEGIYAKGKVWRTVPSSNRLSNNVKNTDVFLSLSPAGKPRWANINLLDLVSYGVKWTTCNDNITRIGNLSYHKTLPIQSEMKGCIYNPKTKEVIYWLDKNDWDFRENPQFKKVILPEEIPSTGITTLTVEDVSGLSIGQCIRTSRNRNFVGRIGSKGEITNIDPNTNSIEVNWFTPPTQATEDLSSDPYIEIGSRLDGYDGEVMVYVPEFYIKSQGAPVSSVGTISYDVPVWVRISQIKIDDTWEHQPATFVAAYKNTILRTVPKDMGYLSTLEVGAAISVVNKSDYCRGGKNRSNLDNDAVDIKRDLGKPATGYNIYSARAAARKAGKEVMSYRQYKNILYWLFVIEYATFDSQASFAPGRDSNGYMHGGLGVGITNLSDSIWSEINGQTAVCINGTTNDFGNSSGESTFYYRGRDGGRYSITANRYRGIENPFGDTYTAVDGILIDGFDYIEDNNILEGEGRRRYKVYTTTDPNKYYSSANAEDNDRVFRETTFSGLVVGLGENGVLYNADIREFDLGSTSEIIPIETGLPGTSGAKHDRTYPSRGGYHIVWMGGKANLGPNCGLSQFDWRLGPTGAFHSVGFRTVCIAPTEE